MKKTFLSNAVVGIAIKEMLKHRLTAAACALLIITASALQAIGPLGLRSAVNALTENNINTAVVATSFYVIIIFMGRLLQSALIFNFVKLWQPIRIAASSAAHKFMLHIEPIEISDKSTGEIAKIVTNGISGLRSILSSVIFGITTTLVQAASIICTLLFIGHINLVASIIIFGLVYGWVFYAGTRRQKEVHQQASNADIKVAGITSDLIYGHETAKIFGIQGELSSRATEALTKSEKLWYIFASNQQKNRLFLVIIFSAFLLTTLNISIYLFAKGRLSPGDFVLINAYIFQIMAPVERLSFAFRDLTQGILYTEDLSKLIENAKRGSATQKKAVRDQTHPLSIRIENLWFSYRARAPVIRGVSFEVGEGKCVAVVGLSGSGKSTLWRIICQLYPAEQGTIFFNGALDSNLGSSNLTPAISVSQQENTMYNATIRENITLWEHGGDIDSVIKMTALESVVSNLPLGLDTPIGERGHRVSGGERQRISLARAIYRRPGLLILDEATSALDSETENVVLNNIKEKLPNITKLIITHRLRTICKCDEIIVLHDGKIIERGSHDALRKRGGRYEAMWNAQAH